MSSSSAAAVKLELDFKVDDFVEAWDVKKEIWYRARVQCVSTSFEQVQYQVVLTEERRQGVTLVVCNDVGRTHIRSIGAESGGGSSKSNAAEGGDDDAKISCGARVNAEFNGEWYAATVVDLDPEDLDGRPFKVRAQGENGWCWSVAPNEIKPINQQKRRAPPTEAAGASGGGGGSASNESARKRQRPAEENKDAAYVKLENFKSGGHGKDADEVREIKRAKRAKYNTYRTAPTLGADGKPRGRIVFRAACHKKSLATYTGGGIKAVYAQKRNGPSDSPEGDVFFPPGSGSFRGNAPWNAGAPAGAGYDGFVDEEILDVVAPDQPTFPLFREATRKKEMLPYEAYNGTNKGYIYCGQYEIEEEWKDCGGGLAQSTRRQFHFADLTAGRKKEFISMRCKPHGMYQHPAFTTDPGFDWTLVTVDEITQQTMTLLKKKESPSDPDIKLDNAYFRDNGIMRPATRIAMFTEWVYAKNEIVNFVGVRFVRYDEKLYKFLCDQGVGSVRDGVIQRMKLDAVPLGLEDL